MRVINIAASNLAKLTGHNRYDSIEETIKYILNSNNIKKYDIPKTNVENQLRLMNKKEISKITKFLGIDHNSDIQYIESIINRSIIVPSSNGDLNEEQAKKIMDDKIEGNLSIPFLNDSIKKDIRIRRGSNRENTNLNKAEVKGNITIGKRNSKMYNKIMFKDPNGLYQVNIRGKVDGISGDHIVESKNRANRLFNELRAYERVQLEAYIHITGIKDAKHIEHYNEESRTINYKHDFDFWCMCIRETRNFIDEHILPHIIQEKNMVPTSDEVQDEKPISEEGQDDKLTSADLSQLVLDNKVQTILNHSD